MLRRDLLRTLGVAPLVGLEKEPSYAPDIAHHARESFHFLENAVELRQSKLLPYFRIDMNRKPGLLDHEHWDWSENLGRWLYGRLFARKILDDNRDLRFEEELVQAIHAGMGPDGLHYYPPVVDCGSSVSGSIAMLWDNRSIFMGLTQLWAITKEQNLRVHLDRMVDSLGRYAVVQGDMAYFAVNGIPPGYRATAARNPVAGQNSGGFILPLVNYYRLSGNEKALALAKRLANFIVRYHYSGKPDEAGPVLAIANVHGALFTIAGIVATVQYSGRKEHLKWAHGLYLHARDHLASSYGWVPEHEVADRRKYPVGSTMSTEGCAIVDFVNLAIRLAQSGYPETWNSIERFVRNFLTAGQLSATSRLDASAPIVRTRCSTNLNMPERAKGAFVGWGGPADFFNPTGRHGAMVQNCCGSHYPFGLALVWENIVGSDGAQINLLLSHETSHCKIESDLPRRGSVRVRMKRSGNLRLRIPDWVPAKLIKVSLGPKSVPAELHNGFLCINGLQMGDVVSTEFPLRHETRRESFMGHTVRAEWLGDTVISISPGGTIVPLFERKFA